MALRQARRDFPRCSEPRYIGEWEGEVVVKVCGDIPVAYLVTPTGAERKR